MASAALTNFDGLVDGLAITEQRKAQVKALGERLYIAGCKETIAHLRKHAVAVSLSPDTTEAQKQRATALIALIDNLVASNTLDAWWIDVTVAD